jgi:GDP-D-mannose 3', 5'-epimerase
MPTPPGSTRPTGSCRPSRLGLPEQDAYPALPEDGFGWAGQTRSFMRVDDCVRGILLILEGDIAQPCNFGSAELVSVNQLVDVIEETAGVRLKRRYNLTAPAGVRRRTSDSARPREAFGWEPSITLQAGLARTCRWVSDQVSARTLTGRRG